MFRAQLAKVKRCHAIQLQYVKQAAKDKANEYLVGQFNRTRGLMIDEVKFAIK